MIRKSVAHWVNIMISLALVLTPLSEMLSAPAGATALAAPGRSANEFAPDRLIVRFQDGARPEQARLEAWGALSAETLFGGAGLAGELAHIYVLRLAPGSDVLNAVQALAAEPGIAWVEPDYLAYPAGDAAETAVAPDDPLYPQQLVQAKVGAAAARDV